MKKMKEKERNEKAEVRVVCFTGHRKIPPEAAEGLPEQLETVISDLCDRGATVFRTGGATGFDTIAALKILEMKEAHPQIRLELILPCKNQTENWDEGNLQTYHYIMQKADNCRFLFETYFDDCMLERDCCLVEGSDVCVAYCVHSQGGTAYTVSLAMKDGLEIINLFDQE